MSPLLGTPLLPRLWRKSYEDYDEDDDEKDNDNDNNNDNDDDADNNDNDHDDINDDNDDNDYDDEDNDHNDDDLSSACYCLCRLPALLGAREWNMGQTWHLLYIVMMIMIMQWW